MPLGYATDISQNYIPLSHPHYIHHTEPMIYTVIGSESRSMSLQLFPVVWIFPRSLGVIYYDRWVLSEGHKNYFKDWCLMNSQPTFLFLTYLTQWILAVLPKAWKPDNFESHDPLKLSFTNIRGLRSNFVECESFLESNSPDILALCETNLDDWIDYGNLSVRGYLPLIWKDSVTHMHGLAVYVKEGLPFARDLSLENSADSYLCFRLALFHSVSYFFFLYRSLSSSLSTVFDSVTSNIDEVLSINHLLMFLSLETLTFIIRTS